jgi:hypothetical protein
MHQNSSFTTHQGALRQIEVDLPVIDALVAGTMVLMTGYIEMKASEGAPSKTEMLVRMAQKIEANLALLAAHPNISPPLTKVFHNLLGHWHLLNVYIPLFHDRSVDLGNAGTRH